MLDNVSSYFPGIVLVPLARRLVLSQQGHRPSAFSWCRNTYPASLAPDGIFNPPTSAHRSPMSSIFV